MCRFSASAFPQTAKNIFRAFGGNRLIYFLAIETAQKSATKDQDLFGRVTLKQTTGDKEYRFGEIAFDVAIELGYVSASKSEGEGIIPIKPASFSKRDGFEEESDYTFEFAAESNASFVVNTNGQGTIVLGMDIDFDDDIGDEYPTADLYFYNGNYAQFNRHRAPSICRAPRATKAIIMSTPSTARAGSRGWMPSGTNMRNAMPSAPISSGATSSRTKS